MSLQYDSIRIITSAHMEKQIVCFKKLYIVEEDRYMITMPGILL